MVLQQNSYLGTSKWHYDALSANFNSRVLADVANDPMNATDPSGMIIRQLIKRGLSRQAAKNVASKARSRARRQAWREERQLVERTGEGTRRWTDAQKQQLLDKGKVKGFKGHHRNTVNGNSLDSARNPDNIEFLTRTEHATKHADAGGTREIMSGNSLLDRTAGGTLPRLPGKTGYDGQGFLKPLSAGLLGGTVAVLDGMKWVDPTAYVAHGLGFSEFCKPDDQGMTC